MAMNAYDPYNQNLSSAFNNNQTIEKLKKSIDKLELEKKE